MHWIRSLREQPNDDTLLYGVEVKFYNMEVSLDEHLESIYPGSRASSATEAA